MEKIAFKNGPWYYYGTTKYTVIRGCGDIILNELEIKMGDLQTDVEQK